MRIEGAELMVEGCGLRVERQGVGIIQGSQFGFRVSGSVIFDILNPNPKSKSIEACEIIPDCSVFPD